MIILERMCAVSSQLLLLRVGFITLCSMGLILAITYILLFTVFVTSAEQHDFIQIEALNRAGDVGFFYNYITDTILPIQGVRERFPPNCTHFLNNPTVYMKYKNIETYSNRFDSLNLGVSAEASLLFGAVEISGTANILKNTDVISKKKLAALLHQTVVTSEYLKLHRREVLAAIDLPLGKFTGATHFIMGVVWGTDNIVEIKYDSTTRAEDSSRGSTTSTSVNREGTSSGTQTSISELRQFYRNATSLELTVYGNLATEEISLSSFADIENFLQKVPALTKKVNSGKGSAVQFTAISIKYLESIINRPIDPPAGSVDPSKQNYTEPDILFFKMTNKMKRFLNEANTNMQKLHSAHKNCKDYALYLPQDISTDIMHTIEDYKIHLAEFRINMKYLLPVARKSTDGIKEKYNDIVIRYSTNSTMPKRIENIFAVMEDFDERIRVYERVKHFGITYLNKYSALQQHALQHLRYGNMAYFLHRGNLKKQNIQSWNAQFEEFLLLQGFPRIFVDCDIKEIMNVSCDFVLKHRKNRKLLNVVTRNRGRYSALDRLRYN